MVARTAPRGNRVPQPPPRAPSALTAFRAPPSIAALALAPDAVAPARPAPRDAPRLSRRARRALRNGVVLVGTAFAVLIVAMAAFAPLLAPVAPDEQNFELLEAPPGRQAWMGTDRLGRDVLSRVIYGSRISLYVATVSIATAMLVGGALGLAAGYLGGRWDNLINRVMDVFFSVPGLLLSVGIAAMRGPGVNSAVIAIAIVYTPIFGRVMRGPVLAEREKEYVEAVRALGAGRVAVALKHVLPNVLSPFVVQGTVAFSQAILIEASLSYLGLSAQPPTPSWGNMLNEGRTYLETAPWISVFPGLAIMVAVLAFNLLGDGLRDVLDPRAQ
jgi:peptide/nickel transport system permease protein